MAAVSRNAPASLFGAMLLLINLGILNMRMQHRAKYAKIAKHPRLFYRKRNKVIWLPESIYESLPYLGTVLGAMLMMLVSLHPFISLIGALMLFMSLLIVQTRMNYRTRYGKAVVQSLS